MAVADVGELMGDRGAKVDVESLRFEDSLLDRYESKLDLQSLNLRAFSPYPQTWCSFQRFHEVQSLPRRRQVSHAEF